MNADPDKQQDELQRMLALKRHETPPPRFFRGFSEKVIDGLNAPPPAGPRNIWQRLGLDFDSRPVLVCASGVVVCALLGTGVILALQIGPARPVPRPAHDQTHWVVAPAPAISPAAEPEVLGPLPQPVQLPSRLNQPVIVPAESSLTVSKPDNAQPAPPADQTNQR